jgi:hypothetical protein
LPGRQLQRAIEYRLFPWIWPVHAVSCVVILPLNAQSANKKARLEATIYFRSAPPGGFFGAAPRPGTWVAQVIPDSGAKSAVFPGTGGMRMRTLQAGH